MGSMSKNLINNYRLGGYLLIAMGLINLRYQSGNSSVLENSLIIIVPGVLLLCSTWISSLSKILDLRATKMLTLVLGLVLVAFAIFN
jgi:uncharacterized membrane protein